MLYNLRYTEKVYTEKVYKPKTYISTSGFVYDSWKTPSVFYPQDIPQENYLTFYATKFNSLTVSSTFFAQPLRGVYDVWIKKVSANPNFKFVILAPKSFSQNTSIAKAKIAWKDFWVETPGLDGYKGGCERLENAGVLGCVVLQFSSKFICDQKGLARLEKLYKILPKTTRFALDFRHWSWWERKGALNFVSDKPNVCIATSYVENGLVDFGWAGNLPSTRVSAALPAVPIIPTTNFVFVTFNGTYGAGIGSYDSKDFLEKAAVRIKNLQDKGIDVFCSFANSESSFCYPLPALVVSGLYLHPQLRQLPFYTKTDRPTCLHDGLRLADLLEKIEKSPNEIGEDGYAKVVFG